MMVQQECKLLKLSNDRKQSSLLEDLLECELDINSVQCRRSSCLRTSADIYRTLYISLTIYMYKTYKN